MKIIDEGSLFSHLFIYLFISIIDFVKRLRPSLPVYVFVRFYLKTEVFKPVPFTCIRFYSFFSVSSFKRLKTIGNFISTCNVVTSLFLIVFLWKNNRKVYVNISLSFALQAYNLCFALCSRWVSAIHS